MKKLNNKGFSLVELIVVIAIMAVLVGVLAPSLIKYVSSARYSKDIQNIDNAVSAINAEQVLNMAFDDDANGYTISAIYKEYTDLGTEPSLTATEHKDETITVYFDEYGQVSTAKCECGLTLYDVDDSNIDYSKDNS